MIPILALAAAEVAGLALCAVEWRDYGWRALSRGAEVWPSLAAACVLPNALLGAVVLVVYALIASGVYTVALARGTATGRIRGEIARRTVVALGNGCFIGVIAAAASPSASIAGVDARTLAWVGVGLVLIAVSRAAVDIAYWARSGT